MQKVLIVEDEKAISGVLHSILSDELTNYEVLVCRRWFRSLQTHRKDDFCIGDFRYKNAKTFWYELLKQALQLKPDTTFS